MLSIDNSATCNMDNPKLKTPKAPVGWQGTPVDQKGRFVNLHHPFIPGLMDVLRWQLQKNPFKQEKKTTIWNPVVMKDDSWLDGSDDVIVWLGHCTFFIRINGIRLLTDPVFGDIFSVKREVAFPVDVHRLLQLDYILLSHDHRDHLDAKSLKILSAQNPQVRYLTGLGMQPIVHRFTQSDKIEEAGWYQQYSSVNITFIPSRHWSKRGVFDTNKRLWGGFVIEVGGKRILFGGDSGYDLHYKQLAAVFGNFDYALIGIGAYEPAWFMSPNHQSPREALQAFNELNARYFIPMHYATFDLSDEPLGQPLKDLHSAAGNDKRVKVLTLGDAFKPVYEAYSEKPV